MLCKTCESIFEGPIPAARSSSGSIVWHNHHADEEAIRSSANAGCQICDPLWQDKDSTISRDGRPHPPYRDLFTLYSIELAERSLEETIRQDSAFVLRLRLSSRKFTWDDVLEFHLLPVAPDPLDLSSNGSPRSGFSVSKKIISRWLSDCVQNHHECCTSLSESWFPTRLIDLGSLPSHHTQRLIITNEHPTFQPSADSQRVGRPVYATLSHCWGKSQPLRLLNSNINDMKQGFSMELVLKTFADVFFVAKGLGIQFIWIDSLCIIQDSTADWLKESTMMGKVYGAAYLNFAATGAVDGREGLLFGHDPRAVAPTQINIRWEGLPEKLYLVVEDEQAWGGRFEGFPLCRRAWALQERILAPRILHFTKEQLIWECRRHVLSESFPSGLPDHLRDYHVVRNFVLPSLQGSFPAAWARVVRLYTGAELTVPRDKLIAISGLASEMRLCGHASGRYVAGMWESQLPISLLWVRADMDDQPSSCHRPEQYRAPSWSWASLDCAADVDWTVSPQWRRREILAKVEESSIDAVENEFVHQSVEASIKISGPLGLVTWAEKFNALDRSKDMMSYRIATVREHEKPLEEVGDNVQILEDNVWNDLFFDSQGDDKPPDTIWCLAIFVGLKNYQHPEGGLYSAPESSVLGLLLDQVKEGVFRRVGAFCVGFPNSEVIVKMKSHTIELV